MSNDAWMTTPSGPQRTLDDPANGAATTASSHDDVPRSVLERSVGRLDGRKRRHRWLTVPSGLVLVLCLFLPAIKGCSEPIRPILVPMAWPPYALGLLVVLAALGSYRTMRGCTLAARVLMWLTAGVVALFMVNDLFDSGLRHATPVGLTLSVCGLLFLVTGFGPRDESAAARATIASGMLGIAFFGMFIFDAGEDILYGMYVSAGASLGLFLGGAEWRREIIRDRSPPVPRARIAG